MSKFTSKIWIVLAAAALATWHGLPAQAATPGITGPSFDLVAQPAYISQPDGQNVYTWGYGCNTAPTGFAPAGITGATCPGMQVPGPTLIVHQGDKVVVTLTNNLPVAAGNTSILFPGFTTTFTNGAPGLLTQEAVHGNSVTYTFVATTPGTHSYYSGTQGDLQIEMGLFGAVVVLPTIGTTSGLPANSDGTTPANCHAGATGGTLLDGQTDFRLAPAAYNHIQACYDREYLFQWSEMDPAIHAQAEKQAGLTCSNCMAVATEPYHPAYFMVNGRSMPDDMDANYAPQYPHQPYNGNPHMHPGELVLVRVIGTGRWQHPFHEHGNHLRVLARDGNLLLAPFVAPVTAATAPLAGPLLFTTTTTPGVALDSIFYWTGRGLNWDVYGHGPACTTPATPTTPGIPAGCFAKGGLYTDVAFPNYLGKPVVCTPDANGYYTADPLAPNYYEWCQDHNKPLEAHPFGQVGSGGPITLPDPNIMKNGTWFGGSPYLGPDATTRATGPLGVTPPSGTIGNPPATEAGFAFMWHSHNEREITTNNIFPGGMMMMMLVDPQAFPINEAN